MKSIIDNILASLDKIGGIDLKDFPNIDLYMDQVTSFMDRNLPKPTKTSDDEKILTKTMINNYAKNNLLPSPDKKKYSKQHLIVLFFIYYFKNVLSIKEIQSLLNPINDKYFNSDGFSLEDIYKEILGNQDDIIDPIKEDVLSKFKMSQDDFKDTKGEEKDMLQAFSFISMMTFDIYVRKVIVQKMIDEFDKKHGVDEE